MTSNDPDIVVLPDPTAVATEAAQRIVSISQQAIREKESFTVALAGGSTPKALYLLLADEPYRSQINWEYTELYWGDERCVPPIHEDSNYRMVKTALLQFVPIPLGNIHRIEAEISPTEAAEKYNKLLHTRFAGEAGKVTKTFDLTLLGLGEDAHTASLFPESNILHDTEHLVMAAKPKDRDWRITLTPTAINRSKQIIFLVTGAKKAGAVKQVLMREKNIETAPAQVIEPYDGTVTWLLDEPAAALL